MRRSRIQVKPNIAKAAKQTVKTEIPAPIPKSDDVTTTSEVVVHDNNQNPLDPPSESMKSLELEHHQSPAKPTIPSSSSSSVHHVHFGDDVIDNEQNNHVAAAGVEPHPPVHHFAVPHPPPQARMIAPRSRNVSMCDDEVILQPKQPRDKKRFTGKEELDTKTWKMSDLARWNPRNEQASYKRERRSSTSSSVISKSDAADIAAEMNTPRINAPQVKIGADGRLVIDETSLVVQSAQINHESVWETVEEGRMGSKITSMSFRSRIFRKPNLWSERETDLFYEVLQCTGQDFGLMHHYLPQRSRPELKAKYNREEKLNWPRLLKAISHPVRLDSDLENRIARFMADIEEEVREKKAEKEYEKEEEKRIRAQLREQRASEKTEERLKKIHARELVRQAKELEKDAREAARTNEKAEKEQRAKERMDAKQMAMEARRIATEARNLIKEARNRERAERELDEDHLEREAERIIRRLIQESRREEKRKRQKEQPTAAPAPPAPASTSDTPLGREPEQANEDVANEEYSSSSTSESSTTASDSDEEALRQVAVRREKERMKTERRNLEPRKTVIDKKPIYVDRLDAKYSQQPVSKTIELVKMANGNMFHSGDEQDELPETVPMETPPAPVAPVIPESSESSASIPKAVSDVIDEIGSGRRSKTPAAADGGEPPAKMARIETRDDPLAPPDVGAEETVGTDTTPEVAETVTVRTSQASTSSAPRRTVKKVMTWQKKK